MARCDLRVFFELSGGPTQEKYVFPFFSENCYSMIVKQEGIRYDN